MKKGTITLRKYLDGKEKVITVEIGYCVATETGYERVSGKSIDVFSPQKEYDDKGNLKGLMPAIATLEDYITLSVAAITAAYAEKGQDAPVTSKDLLYACTPEEIKSIITEVCKLRNEWYLVPSVMQEDTPEKPASKEKND